MNGYIYVLLLGVFSLCISILAGQFVEVGKGKGPSLSLPVRVLMLLIVGFCLGFFTVSVLACEDQDDLTQIELITEYIPCNGGWCKRD